MDEADRPGDDRRRIAKRIAELEKMLRSLHSTKRSTKKLHNIALSGEVSAIAGMLLSQREDAISER